MSSTSAGQTGSGGTGTAFTAGAVADMDRDEVFHVLRNRRRRYTLHYLRREERAEIGDIAEQVAAWENEITAPRSTRHSASGCTTPSSRHTSRSSTTVTSWSTSAGRSS